MAALQCEICGGKLIGKPGGVFECDSCGMEYSTEWARAKVQEIKGTVKIEGPVEVTGTVKVEGGPSVESLLKRGISFLQGEKWERAEDYFDRVLEIEPENDEAYLGLAMVEMEISDRDTFADLFINGWIDTEDEILSRIRLSAGPELKTWLEGLEAERQQHQQEAEKLLKHGMSLLQEEKWEDAEVCFDQVLEIGPQKGEAYLGLAMTEMGIPDRDAFADLYINGEIDAGDEEYEIGEEDEEYEIDEEDEEGEEDEEDGKLDLAWQFAGPELRTWLEELETKRQQRLEELETERQQRLEELETERQQMFQEMALTARLISAGYEHTVGLRADGTAIAVGDKGGDRCKVGRWTDLVAVSAGMYHTVGLRVDGTAVAVGSDSNGECKVGGWTDLVAVSAGEYYTVGLRADGTAVAVGKNENGQCKVGRWTDLVAVSAGAHHTVGLRADGTAVTTDSGYDAAAVESWTDLVAISAGFLHTVGLRADGTAVAVGSNKDDECEVDDWTDLVAISAGCSYTVGLRADGTAVAVGRNTCGECEVGGWTDLVAVSAGFLHTVGLRADGTVVTVGNDLYGKCKVDRWKLFNSWNMWGRKRIAALEAEKASIQMRLSTLQGLFSGGKRRELEVRLAKIEEELKQL